MNELSLYLLSRPDADYGMTTQMLVAAKGEMEARKLAGRSEREHGGKDPFGWVDDADSTIELIGYAVADTKLGVLMTKETAG
jgi:hypothetical protein